MKSNGLTASRLAAVAASPLTAPRYDGYAGIHKALRLFMGDTLAKVGSADPKDADELRSTLTQVGLLLDACMSHIHSENGFVHSALERAVAGSAQRVTSEHESHINSIESLRDLAALVEDTESSRTDALDRLYRALAAFVGENFEHMEVEEKEHNAILWDYYSDEDLRAIDRALVDAIPVPDKLGMLPWFMLALRSDELAGMFKGIRFDAPELFPRILEMARQTVSPANFCKLCVHLEITEADLGG